MTRPTADDLIVHLLGYVKVAPVAYIQRYMAKAWQFRRSTIRQALYRLARDGRIVRVGYGKYALGVDVAPAELNTKPASLTTTLG